MSPAKRKGNRLNLKSLSADVAEIKEALLQTKTVFTPPEAARYMGISLSTLYKMTSAGILRSSKPNGKLIYLSRPMLDEFLLSNMSQSREEKEIAASTYVSTHKSKTS